MPANDRLVGLVLAGGRSRRMGRDKALLRHGDGSTQLARAVRLLERHVQRVYVSTRADQADEPERRRFDQITDRYSDIGPVAGILSALETEPDAHWLVLACDLPNVDDTTVRTLLENRSSQYPFTAYKSTHDGLPEPLCALYAPLARDIIRRFVDDGVVCPRKILIRSGAHLLDQPEPTALDNVNTPEDLARTGTKIAS